MVVRVTRISASPFARPAVTTVLPRDAQAAGDVVLEGTPVALYLTLWNRSDEVTADGDVLDLWRDRSQIRW